MRFTSSSIILLVICSILISSIESSLSIKSILCKNLTSCQNKTIDSDCKTYESPVNVCYNPMNLFQNDSQWGSNDVFDVCSFNGTSPPTINRTFYNSTNASCSGVPEGGFSFLPTMECIGPFGKPRPWGKFSCQSKKKKKT